MAKDAKKYKVTIFGDSFTIVSDESEEHVMHAASLIDTQMKDIADRLGTHDAKRLAVLASLQMVSKLLHLELYFERERLVKERINAELDKALEF